MTKRTLLFLLALTLQSAGGLGQIRCDPSASHLPLVCQIPVATRSQSFAGSPVSNSPAGVFNTTLATQLTQLPLLSSASGVVLVLDKSMGVYVASDNLGPILTERAQTVGKHKLFVAFAYQRFRFNSIDGTPLGRVPFVFQSSAGNSQLYVQQTDKMDFKLDQYVALATFGLDNKTDVSVVLPFERVSLGVGTNGTQYVVGNDGSQQGTAPFNQYVPGAASGLGDMLVNIKRLFWKGERTNFAAGMLLRFPTGDALNYLGSGAYGFNPYAVFSYQAGVSPHVRLGYQFNTTTVLNPTYNSAGEFTGNAGLPGGFQYDVGADAVLIKKVPTSLAVDFLGNYIVSSPVLVPTTFTIPSYGNEFGNLKPGTNSYNSAQLSIGLKVKPWKTLVLYGNVLVQLNNVGLRSNPVPLIGISYMFF
jgi:hypothetical protein